MTFWVKLTYALISLLLLPFALLRLVYRAKSDLSYRPHWQERLGWGESPHAQWHTAPQRIWIHAVSLGETRAVAPLVESLAKNYPLAHFLITHTTPNGRKTSESLLRPILNNRLNVRYLPYDTPYLTDRFVAQWQASLVLLIETELWPHFLRCTKKYAIPSLLINARLSKRSARRYARFAWLARPMLKNLSGIFYQDRFTQRRFKTLGIEERPTTHFPILGNLKFSPPSISPAHLALSQQIRQSWQGNPLKVLLASSRPHEERLFLEAIQSYQTQQQSLPEDQKQSIAFSIVPRHSERCEEIALLAESFGWHVQRKTTWQNQPLNPHTTLLLGDTTGELMSYYHAHDIALLGGSWEDYGSHNPLEALAAQCVLIVGSSHYNFHAIIRAAHQAGALIRTRTMEEAFQQFTTLSTHSQPYKEAGLTFCAKQHDILPNYMAALKAWL